MGKGVPVSISISIGKNRSIDQRFSIGLSLPLPDRMSSDGVSVASIHSGGVAKMSLVGQVSGGGDLVGMIVGDYSSVGVRHKTGLSITLPYGVERMSVCTGIYGRIAEESLGGEVGGSSGLVGGV